MAVQSFRVDTRKRAITRFCAVAALSTLAGWCSAAMICRGVGITCQMIFVRFALNGSTTWQTEAVIYLAIGPHFDRLPYVQRLRGHVNVDLIPLVLRGQAAVCPCVVHAVPVDRHGRHHAVVRL